MHSLSQSGITQHADFHSSKFLLCVASDFPLYDISSDPLLPSAHEFLSVSFSTCHEAKTTETPAGRTQPMQFVLVSFTVMHQKHYLQKKINSSAERVGCIHMVLKTNCQSAFGCWKVWDVDRGTARVMLFSSWRFSHGSWPYMHVIHSFTVILQLHLLRKYLCLTVGH